MTVNKNLTLPLPTLLECIAIIAEVLALTLLYYS